MFDQQFSSSNSFVASMSQSAYLTRHHALYQVSLSTSLTHPHLTSTRQVWYWSLEDERFKALFYNMNATYMAFSAAFLVAQQLQ